MAAPVKNESCGVCDENLPKNVDDRYLMSFFFFFIVHDQLCELLGRVLLRAF